MKVGLASLDPVWRNKKETLRHCITALDSIKNQKCELIIFPEMSLTGFYVDGTEEAEPKSDSWTVQQFKRLAIEYQTTIIFGVLLQDDNNQFYNSMVTVNKLGDVLSCYYKVHLFSYAGEDECFHSGKEVIVTNTNNINFLNSICYDLRFPPLYSARALETDMLINIANWPATRTVQWRDLLKARAIENLNFMVGVNRTGDDGNGLSYSKSSYIFSPLGEDLSPIFSKNNIDVYELDITLAKKTKSQLPFLNDRKKELYKSWLNQNH